MRDAEAAITRRDAWIFAAAQSLGGLVGERLASDPALITLPVSLLNLGLALGTLPAVAAMHRFGRRMGYLVGACLTRAMAEPDRVNPTLDRMTRSENLLDASGIRSRRRTSSPWSTNR